MVEEDDRKDIMYSDILGIIPEGRDWGNGLLNRGHWREASNEHQDAGRE